MNWKPEIFDAGEWIGNGLTFATKDECVMYSLDLACRFSGAGRHRAKQTDRTVTHRYVNGSLEYLVNEGV